MANLAKTLFWVISGYRKISIMAFPLLIIKGDSLSVHLLFSHEKTTETIYPADFITELEKGYDKTKAENKMAGCETWFLIAQVIVLMILAAVLFFLGIIYLLPAAAAALVPLYFLNSLQISDYHGPIIRLRNIKRGKGLYYLAVNQIANSTELSPIYRLAEKEIQDDSDDPDDLKIYRVIILRHIYMLMTDELNSTYEPMQSTVAYINKNVIDGDTLSLSSRGGIEKWEFLKVYICYAIILDKNEALEQILSTLNRMWERYGPLMSPSGNKILSNSVRMTIQWYINIVRFKKIDLGRKSTLSRNRVVGRDLVLRRFPTYQSIYDSIIEKMLNICTVVKE